MKIINSPTIELSKKDIETIEELRKLIIDMPCSSLRCEKCPFDSFCNFVNTNEEKENTILNIQKILNEALI